MSKQAQQAKLEAVRNIATDILGIETLETRNMDGLDFSDQAVWSIEEALIAAYEAGQASK